MPFDSGQSAVEEAAVHENAAQYLDGDIRKVIYVKTD